MGNTHICYDFTHFCYLVLGLLKLTFCWFRTITTHSKKFKQERFLFRLFKELCQESSGSHTWATRWFPTKLNWTWCWESRRFKAIVGWRWCWSRYRGNSCWNWFVDLSSLMLIVWPSFWSSFLVLCELCFFFIKIFLSSTCFSYEANMIFLKSGHKLVWWWLLVINLTFHIL
jgi:hypothetical protein